MTNSPASPTRRPRAPRRPTMRRAQDPLSNFILVIVTCGLCLPLSWFYGAPHVARVNRARMERYSRAMETYRAELARWESAQSR